MRIVAFRGPAVLALAAAIASSAGAQPLPPVQNRGEVTYVSGGIGSDESEAMKQAAPRYALEILLVGKAEDGGGTYLAGNRVVIQDSSGEPMLDTQTDGPYLLVNLPPGRYTVTAWHDGAAKSQAMQILPGQHRRIVFLW
jgi:hypothetical protein